METNKLSNKEIRGIAFVDAVSKPAEVVNSYQRIDVVLDVISASAFEAGKDNWRNPEDLWIVRIMSTLNRLQTRFSIGVGDLTEGSWFKVIFRDSEGDPPAWILEAVNDYSGPIRRTNLVDLKPMLLVQPGLPKTNLPNGFFNLCKPVQVKPDPNLDQGNIPSLPKREYFVRVVDVGHANFSVIHLSRNPDEDVVGYFDVGGPVFFHHRSFPSVFNESKRVPSQGFVVLSHWDFDHYSLAVTKLKSLQNLRWYAPYQNIGPNSARLQQQLGGNLTLLDQRSFQVAQGLHLWKGMGDISDRNNSGYVMTVSSQTTKVLLTGDAAYDMIPTQAKTNLSALSITHHGGSGSGTPPSPMNGKKVAAVSYGVPNRYHHPDANNLRNHTAIGWTVRQTFDTQTLRGDVWLD